MNKIIDTSTRLFMAVEGPSGSGKTELIFKLLTGRSFYPKFERVLFFLQRYSTCSYGRVKRTQNSYLTDSIV